MSRLGNIGNGLYRGEVSYDFVGNQKRWYAISGLILLITVAALVFHPLQLGIEFKGGAEFQVNGTSSCSVADARAAASDVTGTEVIAQRIGSGGSASVRVQTKELATQELRVEVQEAIAKACGVQADDVSSSQVSGSWGADISKKALRGLIVFLVLVALYMAAAFREWKMSVAALVALAHDLVITAGVYALVGFEVTPATVVGILTILGYSLYDTVVVFDKVRENTAGIQGGSRYTYSGAANLAVNQTLVRSINTSVIALLPVAGILFVGVGILGAGAMKDIALALFVGIAAGTYSSIFIATPLLADLKEREPGMRALAKRVAARNAAVSKGAPAARGGATSGAAAPARSGGATALLVDPDGEVEPVVTDAEAPVAEPTAPSDGAARVRRPASAGQRSQPRRNGPNRPGKRR
ncbi:preprotein translocase subunit SecF [Motilibacter peucedani]|uniref:Protein-export membrane protein SecF n=1 Tax=Motilibacter peucedani TaxID=598650 RepID=A0A420XS77_9ACTN|nr:protein translocase subunit SecF [Motilibacter peucedani]RKS77732.1 preprotein translocase subunit SecF [Motilibacter peucedani]